VELLEVLGFHLSFLGLKITLKVDPKIPSTRLEIISDVVSEKTDVVSEFFRYVPFPIPHRKLFLTVHFIKELSTHYFPLSKTFPKINLHKSDLHAELQLKGSD
jgi:hypothetical protein